VRDQRPAPAALYPRERAGTIVQEAGWAPGPAWTGAENLASIGIRSPDRPARNQSLYRLSYRGARKLLVIGEIQWPISAEGQIRKINTYVYIKRILFLFDERGGAWLHPAAPFGYAPENLD